MTLDREEVQHRAKRRFASIRRRRMDPRYQSVVGRLKAAGLLYTNDDIPEHREPIQIKDALWAGEVEPRILELLPALIVKKPSLFISVTDLPKELEDVVRALRKGKPPSLRGVSGTDIARWVPRVGHRGKRPSRAKTFRLTQDDLSLLSKLSDELGLSETDTVRRGLRALARSRTGDA